MNREASFTTTIHSVGPNIETALQSLATDLQWGTVTNLRYRHCLDVPHEWDCGFATSDGVKRRAAGQDVRGGVIVTWWREHPFQ